MLFLIDVSAYQTSAQNVVRLPDRKLDLSLYHNLLN